jgi:hypothetical protein
MLISWHLFPHYSISRPTFCKCGLTGHISFSLKVNELIILSDKSYGLSKKKNRMFNSHFYPGWALTLLFGVWGLTSFPK